MISANDIIMRQQIAAKLTLDAKMTEYQAALVLGKREAIESTRMELHNLLDVWCDHTQTMVGMIMGRGK